MPTIITAESECSLCGARSPQTLVGPSNTQDLPDLDTRPAEMARSTLTYWVQRCPHCGYCATDISLEYPQAEAVVRSDSYQKLLRRRSLPEKARQFLAWGLIEEANDEPGAAGWSALHAAWVCDDAEAFKAAGECRLLALERFHRQRAQVGHILGITDPGLSELLLADLCRRTGQFEQAIAWCNAGLNFEPDEGVRRALAVEYDLADRQDPTGHTLEEL